MRDELVIFSKQNLHINKLVLIYQNKSYCQLPQTLKVFIRLKDIHFINYCNKSISVETIDFDLSTDVEKKWISL
jgi:hypothetical protein